MNRFLTLTMALAFTASTVLPQAAIAQERYEEDGEQKKDNTAAIVAGLAVLGVGIAIATSKHGKDHDHDDQWDGNLYGKPFSPAQGVTCVPRQRQCFQYGNFSYSWTKRIFGTSGGFGGSGNSGGGFGGSGGSGSSYDLDRARRVCVDDGRDRGMRNIRVESVRPAGSKRANVTMQSRRSSSTVNYERWRCEYRYSNGKTSFSRI